MFTDGQKVKAREDSYAKKALQAVKPKIRFEIRLHEKEESS